MCEVLWYEMFSGVMKCQPACLLLVLVTAYTSLLCCPLPERTSILALACFCPCSVLGNGRGRLPVTGSDFCRLTYHMHTHSVALLVSQSGQT